MSKLQIELFFHGPYFTIETLRDGVYEYGLETRLLYIAFANGCNSKDGCDVAYVGVSQQKEPYKRFYGHHKLPGIKNVRELWAGYFKREAAPMVNRRVLDERLRAAEDTMIAWFLPPENDAGIEKVRDGKELKQKEWIGNGATTACSIEFFWRDQATEEPRAAPKNFPKRLDYSVSSGYITAIY